LQAGGSAGASLGEAETTGRVAVEATREELASAEDWATVVNVASDPNFMFAKELRVSSHFLTVMAQRGLLFGSGPMLALSLSLSLAFAAL
jgi:hypothetical protein